MFGSRNFKTGWVFHINRLGENTIQEISNNVYVMKIPAKGNKEGNNGPECEPLNNKGGCFVKVYSRLLFKSPSNKRCQALS